MQSEEGSYAQSLADGLQRVNDFLRAEASSRLAQVREEERRLHKSVASLQRQLEAHPSSVWVGEQLGQVQSELHGAEERRFAFLFHKQASHWVQVGDRVTRDFFSIVGPRHSRAGVQRLRREDGSLASTPDEMRELATQFYRELLSQDPPSPTMEGNRQLVLSYVRRTVTEGMCSQLLAPFTEQELLEALRALAKGSCPGVDGLAPAFFLMHWETLAPGLCLAF